MARSRPHRTSNRNRQWLWRVLSYAIAAGCLYWVFHDIRFRELLDSIMGLRWWWVPLAVLFDLLVYVCAAWEWQLLLTPVAHLGLRQSLQAMLAGRFANDVLPLHAGYIIRVYLAARAGGRQVADILPSLLIERLFDVLWLVLGIGLTTIFFPLPERLVRTGQILGGAIVIAVAAVAWTILRNQAPSTGQLRPISSRWKTLTRFRAFAHRLAKGIRGIGRSRLILAALGLSIVKLVLQALCFLALLRAYAFPFPLRIKLAMFLIAYVGISIPSTPAGIGVFQAVCAAGLRFFGAPKPAAASFALVAYVVWSAPLAIAGFIAVARSGLTLRQIREEFSQWMAQRAQMPGS